MVAVLADAEVVKTDLVFLQGIKLDQDTFVFSCNVLVQKVTANSWGSGLFILFLVFFAIIAAGYVLIEGIENRNRSRYKLLLNCSMIITAVVPLELPMELSMVVDICCFDKTGTLTSDDMMQCLDIKDPKEEDTLSALYYVVPSMQTNMETMYHIRTESQMNAKLSDFGVIREGPKDEPTHVSTMVESIKKISENVAQLSGVSKGVWHFNQMLFKDLTDGDGIFNGVGLDNF
ncbi:probable manganese-transporting ATPase PDR2 [Tanacetum coccineum]